jgi:hypothetical protein
MDLGAACLEQVGRPVPAVGRLQHDLGVGAGLGQFQRQRHRVVIDADGLQHLPRRGHAHDHRAAAVQVDPDVLFSHGASLAVAGVTPLSVRYLGSSRGAEAPLLHGINPEAGREELLYGLKAGPAGGLRPPAGPATTPRLPEEPASPSALSDSVSTVD